MSEAEKSCSNCGHSLLGQYCSRCGQRANIKLITLWELARDLVGDLFELDSRLWRTLRPLLFKPGLLTREYLAGRRVHYVPPFRMYLVLSLAFFLIAAMGRSIQVTTDLGDSGPGLDQTAGGEGAVQPQEEELADGRTVPEESRDGSCLELSGEERAGIAEYVPIEALETTCRRIRDDPSAFGNALVDNVPTMLFFFLPLIAVAMKVLYLGSGRYYVEHLLFFVHYHSFFFLILTLNVLLWRLADLLPIGRVIPGLVTATVTIYIPVYLFRAMRVVYERAGVVRYLFLLTAYFVCLLLTLGLMVIFTALTL